MADFAHYVKTQMGPVPAVSIIADGGFPVCYAQKGGYDAAFLIPAGKNIVDFVGGSVRNAIPDTAVLTVSGITLEEAQKALSGVERIDLEADGANVKLIGRGKAGHAAGPAEDVQNSAIAIAAAAAAVLEEKTGLDLAGCRTIGHAFVDAFGTNLGIAYADEQSGKLTINAGVIRMEGRNFHLDIDIRYPVTMKSETITASLDSYLTARGARLVEVNATNPYYIDPKDPKVTALLEVYRQITGDMTEPYAMGGGTYSRVVPGGITFGPGMMRAGGHKATFLPEGHGGAHGPDEALSIEDWLTAFKIYVLSVARLDEAMSE